MHEVAISVNQCASMCTSLLSVNECWPHPVASMPQVR